MLYYVYFDSYRRPKQAVSEDELAGRYKNDPDGFWRSMCGLPPDAPIEQTVGHVGVMRFETQGELQAYMEATGEEISGFYECKEDCRPYNF
jgi:hypothetical protein